MVSVPPLDPGILCRSVCVVVTWHGRTHQWLAVSVPAQGDGRVRLYLRELNAIAHQLDTRPRTCLDFATPLEADAQYRYIKRSLPTQRGNVMLDNLQVLNAILYVAEQGCKWHGLPKRFGNWHTIYTRMNRWTKSGVLDRLFAQLQQVQIIRVKIEAVALDSTLVKVHPDGTGS